ncbi:hypothetical protein LWI28_018312 [Acer negundo]|uniref:Uncharacterized protein n=1 Tax=Acer negundo TaxID=4023 RepID=A0AAD5NTG7_ACENE|nr:hypothetical protein LWI28_018312 [Acer negundo]
MDAHEFESEGYEEEEEEDVGYDESSRVVTIVTTFASAGSHRPRSLLSLPDSGEMSRPKRKTSVDGQRELGRLVYEKKTSDGHFLSRKATVFPLFPLPSHLSSF